MVAAEGALALLAIGLGRVVGVHPLGGIDLDVRGLAWGVLATAPLLLGLVVSTRIRSGPLARLLELVRERIRPLFADCSAGDLALIALSAGVGEELLFRGLIQPGLAIWMPAWAALAIASALFGLAHLVTLTYSLLAGLIGLYLGALLLASDNLLAPVLAHALYDLAALHLLVRLKPAPARSVV